MEDASERIRRWAKAGEDHCAAGLERAAHHPTLYGSGDFLPGENLFFERDGQSSLLTSSMINNYVKTGVLPHPEKKRNTEGNIWPHFWPCVCSNRFCPSRTLKPAGWGGAF